MYHFPVMGKNGAAGDVGGAILDKFNLLSYLLLFFAKLAVNIDVI